MISLPFELAFKYLKSNKGGLFSFTSILAIVGLCVGVSSLIIVTSVMNGFEKELQNRILGVVPHSLITSNEPIQNYSTIITDLEKQDNILQASPYISFQAISSSKYSNRGVMVTGIDYKKEKFISIIPQYIIDGSIEFLEKPNSIIIGSWLAADLGVFLGDKINITTSDIKTSIIGSYPKSVEVEIVGIFELRAEIDQSLTFISHRTAQKLKGLDTNTQSIRLKTTNLFDADKISIEAISMLDRSNQDFGYISWKETHGTLFEAIKFEKLLIGMMLFLIVFVASIMVLSTILMTVKSKEKEIAILKTIGTNNKTLILIFFYQGLIISTIGVFFGILIGLLVTPNITYLVEFIENISNRSLLAEYFINYFPYSFNNFQILIIAFFSLLFGIIFSIIPAIKATSIIPAEILRHD